MLRRCALAILPGAEQAARPPVSLLDASGAAIEGDVPLAAAAGFAALKRGLEEPGSVPTKAPWTVDGRTSRNSAFDGGERNSKFAAWPDAPFRPLPPAAAAVALHAALDAAHAALDAAHAANFEFAASDGPPAPYASRRAALSARLAARGPRDCVPAPPAERLDEFGAIALMETTAGLGSAARLRSSAHAGNIIDKLIDKMLESVLKGPLASVLTILGTLLGTLLGGAIEEKHNAGSGGDREMIEMTEKSLTPALVDDLLRMLVHPASTATVGVASEAVSLSLSSWLSRSIASSMHSRIAPRLTSTLTATLPGPIEIKVARELARRLSRTLVRSLVRSLTHAVAPALLHTLSHSPIQDYYCYYCYKHKLYCQYCHYAPAQIYFSMYYASYYSGYYADYYGGTAA
jgi:hypothetical protein